MPWREVSVVSLREEFVALARAEGANVRALCRRYGVGPATAYKWLGRFAREGPDGLRDRSRRPHGCPARTPAETEAAVLAVRDAHPAWGGRKIAARLAALGVAEVPHPNTVTAILRRSGRLAPAAAGPPAAWRRFERAAPNELWQLDFKGHFALGASGARCHPLTALDDHSRFCVALAACPDERGETVRAHLTAAFRRYGLPDRLVMDNGSPWGGGGPEQPYTPLTVWLLRLGIGVGHGRP